jgi:hypothetical protein
MLVESGRALFPKPPLGRCHLTHDELSRRDLLLHLPQTLLALVFLSFAVCLTHRSDYPSPERGLRKHANICSYDGAATRAIERRALWLAEDAARELPNLPLEDALQLVHLYFERGSPKAEPAARRWLVRYLGEGTLSLRDVAKVTASLARANSMRAC